MTNEQKQAIIEQLNHQTQRELEASYDDMLDSCNEPVKLMGCEYAPSDVLKNVDPIAYRCGFNDWLDAECQDGIFIEVNNEYYVASEVAELLEVEA